MDILRPILTDVEDPDIGGKPRGNASKIHFVAASLVKFFECHVKVTELNNCKMKPTSKNCILLMQHYTVIRKHRIAMF